MKRYGLFIADFAPPTVKHLGVAREFIEENRLDKLYVIPTRGHAETEINSFSAVERLDMCAVAFSYISCAFVSDELAGKNEMTAIGSIIDRLSLECGELYLLVDDGIFSEIDGCFYKVKACSAFKSDSSSAIPASVEGYLRERADYLKNREKIIGYLTEALGEKRYRHTLGVEETALKLARAVCPESLTDIGYASLLHDAIKELSHSEQAELARHSPFALPESGIATVNALHALGAPAFVKEHFGFASTDTVLSAIYKHTLGDTDMSVEDMVIFVADFIEPNRTYPDCISLRNRLFEAIERACFRDEAINALALSAIDSITSTEASLVARGIAIDKQTILAKKYLCEKYLH